MNKNDLKFMVEKIRSRYVEKEATELDALRALDAEVKRPATVFGYTFGSVGAVVMGAGMSLVMTDIGATIGLAGAMATGIVIGILGLGMAIATYPLYKRILGARKAKYADKILALGDSIMDAE